MGIPKKGSRKIDINGRPFRFLVKETTIDGHRDQKELSVVVQEDVDKPGNVLRLRAPYGHPVTPEFILEVVQEAFTQGWIPEQRGSAFDLKERP